MKTTDRRSFLQVSLSGLVGLASVPLLGGGLAGCQQLSTRQPTGQPSGRTTARPPGAATARKTALTTEKLADRVTLITGAPGNVIALASDDGVVLVDSGAADSARAVKASLAGAKVRTLFNTHYHADQTGGNALFARRARKSTPT